MAIQRYQSVFMGGKFDDGRTRYRVGEAEAATQIFQHGAEPVQNANHLGSCFNNALKVIPLAHETIGAVPSLDQGAIRHAVKVRQVLVEVNELLFLARLHFKTYNVISGHSFLLRRGPRWWKSTPIHAPCVALVSSGVST